MTKYLLCTIFLALIAVNPSICQDEGLPQCPNNNEEEVYIPNDKDCSSFYQCSNGIPILQHCPPGLEFNSHLDVCVQPEQSNCKVVTPTEEPTAPTEEPTAPTEEPTSSTEEPTSSTEEPTSPTEEPTSPTEEPTSPTEEPTSSTEEPTSPTEEPTSPTEEPTAPPTERPTERPTTHHPHFPRPPHIPQFPHYPHLPHLPQPPHLPHLPQPPHLPHLPQPPHLPGRYDHHQNRPRPQWPQFGNQESLPGRQQHAPWFGQQEQGRQHLGNFNRQPQQGRFRPGHGF